jgi:hypothetical protein
MRFLLLFLSLVPAWGGSINLFGIGSSSCVVTTLPTNDIVANDCNSTPGISASGAGSLFIGVAWGEGIFQVNYAGSDGLMVSNTAADPNLVATESVSGHLEYDQNFIVTGGSGIGYISSSLPQEGDPGGANCGFSVSTAAMNPGGEAPFIFGVPFTVQIFVDLNSQLSAPHLFNRNAGADCQNTFGPQLFNAQGQALTGFDIEPTEAPEPRTWLLLSAGLLGCWLMKSRTKTA